MNAASGWDPPPPPPGWYSRPSDLPRQRFAPTPPPELPALYLPNLIAAMIASVGVVIGSLGPWLTFLALNRTATDGDGVITLVLGVVATAALFVILSLGRSRASGGDDTGRMMALGWVAIIAGTLTSRGPRR